MKYNKHIIKLMAIAGLPLMLGSCTKDNPFNPLKEVNIADVFPFIGKINDMAATIAVVLFIIAFICSFLWLMRFLFVHNRNNGYEYGYEMREDNWAIAFLCICAICVFLAGISMIMYMKTH